MSNLPQVTTRDTTLTSAGGGPNAASGLFGVLDILSGCVGTGGFSVMPCLSERDQDQASNHNTPLARPLTQRGTIVNLGDSH